MKRISIVTAALAIMFMVGLGNTAWGQSSRANIGGRVLDAQGAAVPNAEVVVIGDETGVTIWRRSGRTRIAQGANQWSPGEEHLQCEVGADGLHRRRGNTSFDRRIPREGLDGDFLEFGKLPRVIPAALWRCQGD